MPLDLLANGNPIDAATLTVPANDSAGVTFTLGNLDPSVLELRIATPDALRARQSRLGSREFIAHVRKCCSLRSGNKPLELALSTPRAHELAEVTIAAPNVLKTKDHQQAAATGAYDLIIYDRCIPERMPEANTLFIAAAPPNAGINSWSLGDPVTSPQIIDSARNHPLMQWLDLGNVEIAEARPVTPPPGGTRLIDSNKGTLLAIAPRDEFEDAVLGFEISSVDKQGQPVANTNWPIRGSFPTFIYNVLQYLGGNRESLNSQSLQPGHPITLKSNALPISFKCARRRAQPSRFPAARRARSTSPPPKNSALTKFSRTTKSRSDSLSICSIPWKAISVSRRKTRCKSDNLPCRAKQRTLPYAAKLGNGSWRLHWSYLSWSGISTTVASTSKMARR